MQHSFKFSNILKWSFGLLALLLVTTTVQAQTVEAVITNDLDCDIQVRVYGRVGTTNCTMTHVCAADFVLSPGSHTILPSDMPCNVDEFLATRVKTDCSSIHKTVEKNPGCQGNPQSATISLTGVCVTNCGTSTVNIDLTQGSYDIDVQVY